MNYLIYLAMSKIVPLIFLYGDDCGVKKTLYVEMPLNKKAEEK